MDRHYHLQPVEKESSHPGYGIIFVSLILIAIAFYYAAFPHKSHGQTPNLVVSAGTQNLAPTLTITSDSTMPWKGFSISGGAPGTSGSAGNYGVIWAESNGTTGGIYFGTIQTSSSGPAALPGPVTPPAPTNDLPIGTLTTAVSASIATVDQATATTAATTYESLAKSVDTKVIVSPLQLQLATGTQLLANFTSDQLGDLKNVTAAVAGWLDAQQCAGKLTADRMDKYSTAYHAIAQAIKPGVVTAAAVKITGVPPIAAARAEPKQAPTKPKSACENGQCPMPRWGRRR